MRHYKKLENSAAECSREVNVMHVFTRHTTRRSSTASMDTDNAQLLDEFPPSCRLSMLTFGACQDTPIIQATTTVGLRNTRYLQKNCHPKT